MLQPFVCGLGVARNVIGILPVSMRCQSLPHVAYTCTEERWGCKSVPFLFPNRVRYLATCHAGSKSFGYTDTLKVESAVLDFFRVSACHDSEGEQSLRNDQLVQTRFAVLRAARLDEQVGQDHRFTLPVRVSTQHSQSAFGILSHNLDKNITYSTASEMRQKFIVGNLSIEPTCFFERRHVRQQNQILKTRDSREQLAFEIARGLIAEFAQFGKAA